MLGDRFFFFHTLNTLSHSLMACKVSNGNQLVTTIEFPLSLSRHGFLCLFLPVSSSYFCLWFLTLWLQNVLVGLLKVEPVYLALDSFFMPIEDSRFRNLTVAVPWIAFRSLLFWTPTGHSSEPSFVHSKSLRHLPSLARSLPMLSFVDGCSNLCMDFPILLWILCS